MVVKPENTPYKCPVLLITEKEGGFSAVSANLPGVGSQGETEEEALANFEEAMAGALASYREHGEEIPWTEEEQGAPEDRKRWIIVHG
jgi:antitoxin HicB